MNQELISFFFDVAFDASLLGYAYHLHGRLNKTNRQLSELAETSAKVARLQYESIKADIKWKDKCIDYFCSLEGITRAEMSRRGFTVIENEELGK